MSNSEDSSGNKLDNFSDLHKDIIVNEFQSKQEIELQTMDKK